jgi:hypothetical protein
VEWLGDKRVKLEVVGSSAGGREAHVYHCEKSCDGMLVWLLSESPLVFKKNPIFWHNFFGFFGNLITVSFRTGSDEPPSSLPLWLCLFKKPAPMFNSVVVLVLHNIG